MKAAKYQWHQHRNGMNIAPHRTDAAPGTNDLMANHIARFSWRLHFRDTFNACYNHRGKTNVTLTGVIYGFNGNNRSDNDGL